jgi:CDP-glycerol glycerophosphotransferase
VASLREDLSLIYDTTAWNKVYRRSFLQQHALRFPEGVLYEDLPVTVRALYFAGSVPCVHEPVYSWRTREEGGSITQRRNELANLVDRFAAVRDVDGFLAEHELADLRAAHDLKVLGLDLPLYTSALPEADDEYRTTYLSFVEHLVRDLPEDRRNALPPTLRLYLELAEAGRMEDLVAAVRARRGARAWATDDSRGRLQRIREDLATYRLELELGLVTRRQATRRAAATTTKILLPERLRDAAVGLRRRGAGPGG